MKYRISREDAKNRVSQIIISVDFGGSGSGHAFVATGISRDFRDVIALASERHFGDIDPNKLGDLFVDFVLKIINVYGMPDICYADSAEQTLIRGLRSSLLKANINLAIDNAWKTEINERIRATNRLMGQMRLYLTDDCESLETAFCTAVWNPKELTVDERLDDGSSDIDSLDAFEYTIERYIELLIITEV